MHILRYLGVITFFIFFKKLGCTQADLSVEDKINFHKEWMERRPNNSSLTNEQKADYIRQLMSKLAENTNDLITTTEYENNDWEDDYFEPTTVESETNEISKFLIKNSTIPATPSAINNEENSISNSITGVTNTTAKPIRHSNNQLLENESKNILNSVENVKNQFENGKIADENSENLTVRHVFGPWSDWTECSRSCGGGVKSQHRKCWRREYLNGKKTDSPPTPSFDCIGTVKRFHLCNEKDCPLKSDFREEQCIKFNKQIFQEKRYVWEAYVKDDAECELNCKPVGMRYFATLNKTVIDGTECTKPAEYYRKNGLVKAICVEGVCKALHNSGVITGTFMNNGAVRCGVSVCRPISGIFTKNPLTQGYHHVATIPAGASNITVTELQNSVNFLALKTSDQKFVINGDFKISLSATYEAAGTEFEYRRIDGLINGSTNANRKIEGATEWITCSGPTLEPVHLIVLAQQHNPGIKYEYLLPVNTQPNESEEDVRNENPESGEAFSLKSAQITSNSVQTNQHTHNHQKHHPSSKPGHRKRKFHWKIVGYNACSKSCGGGIRTAIIKCIREGPSRYFSHKKCAHLKQPIINEADMRCNTQPCPAYWKISDWTDCQCENSVLEVLRTREVKCVQELMSGVVIQVSNGACMDDKPLSKEICDCPPKPTEQPTPTTIKTELLENVYNATTTTTMASTTVHHHHHNQQSDMGGNGNRKVRYHNTTIINTNQRLTEPKKNGIWLTADWNKRCSASCGTGLQYRSIFCDRNSSPNSERCDLRFTPDTTRECTAEKICENFGEWFTGPWSLCSGDCFNLTRSRSVICVKNEAFVSEAECDIDGRPNSVESCDISEFDDCKSRWHFSDWNECTKPCDGGNQRRIVKCLEPNLREKQMKESHSCKYSEKPPTFRTCNIQSCSEMSSTTQPHADPRVDLIQNDSSCRDDFPNCNIVMRARLCSYAYYNEHCCQTCRTKSNELY